MTTRFPALPSGRPLTGNPTPMRHPLATNRHPAATPRFAPLTPFDAQPDCQQTGAQAPPAAAAEGGSRSVQKRSRRRRPTPAGRRSPNSTNRSTTTLPILPILSTPTVQKTESIS